MFVINFAVTWSWMLVVAAVLASLSASLMRMFINAAILGAVVVGVMLLKEVLVPAVYQVRQVDKSLELGWMALIPLSIAAGALGVLIWQYLAGRPRAGMALFTGLLGAGFLSFGKGREFGGFEDLASRGLKGNDEWGEVGIQLQWTENKKKKKGNGLIGSPVGLGDEDFMAIGCFAMFQNLPKAGFVSERPVSREGAYEQWSDLEK